MKKILLIVLCVFFVYGSAYGMASSPTKSSSGVLKANITVATGSDGLTIEQRNVKNRITEDNKVGELKHFYVISPYSGQVIIYSTVRSKVTSSGKRLSPYEVASCGEVCDGFDIYIDDGRYRTNEVLQDDGTYGHSVPYIYWWDSKGIYHQHFFTGGQIIHLSDQPLPVKNIVINMEITGSPSSVKLGK